MKAVCVIGLSLSLSGCISLERETLFVRTYAPSLGPPETLGESTGKSLAVARFDISPRFSRREFVYRQGEVLFEADPYHVFLAEPELLLTEETERWLRGTGLFVHVGSPSQLPAAELRLTATVEALYGDYRDPLMPRAVLALHVLVRDGGGLKIDRHYNGTVRLDGSGRPELVGGWQEGLRRILSEFTSDVRRMPAAGQATPLR